MEKGFLNKNINLAQNIILFILCMNQFIFFNYLNLIVPLIILVSILEVETKKEEFASKKHIISLLIMIALQVITLLFRKYIFIIFVATVSTLVSFYLLIYTLYKRRKDGIKRRKILSYIGYILLTLTTFFAATFIISAWSPDILSRITQGDVGMNKVTKQTKEIRDDKVTVYRDVTYPSKYPNNTLNIFLTKENKGTMFYIHGGGLVTGDKAAEEQNPYLEKWIENGYNLISIDYALSPQYRYPVATIQANEALKYIIKNADTYNIDKNKIVLFGDSAGGQISGQLSNIQTNPEYASSLGITPALKSSHAKIRGYISIAGLVDMPRYSNTGFFVMDWCFNIWGCSVFNDLNYADSTSAKEASVLQNVNKNFPTSFISDGNFATFTDQGKDLANKLKKLGVKVKSNFVPRSKAILPHDYELLVNYSSNAKDNFKKQLKFVDDIMNEK